MKSSVFQLNTHETIDKQLLKIDFEPQLLLVFGEREILESTNYYTKLHSAFPSSNIVSCSTSGEILQTQVNDDTLVIAALCFDKTPLEFAIANCANFTSSYQLGASLVKQLPQKDLKYILVLSDGNKINGTELTSAISNNVNENVLITGGLAGDKARFEKTLVGLNNNVAEGNLVLIGFYGNSIKVNHGLKGGWDIFGPERTITKSESNILFDIDGHNALELYKKYLGKYSDELPGSALLFPLAIKSTQSEDAVVRTILSIDEEKQTMTFAGDMPVGSSVRFMKANFDKLIQSAGDAAKSSMAAQTQSPNFVLLISCVGRKLVLGNRTEEEVEAAAEVFENANIAGFYSYGEISPLQVGSCSNLHNQTMTITTFFED